jgi:hypothetical protein
MVIYFSYPQISMYILCLSFYEKLSIINFIINHANAAIINHHIAIIIVSFHFVLSCSRDHSNILYAHIIINIIATVPATHIKKFITEFIIFGMSVSSKFQHLTASFQSLSNVLPSQGFLSSSAKDKFIFVIINININMYFFNFIFF